MSRLREAEREFARQLKVAADLIDPTVAPAHRRYLNATVTDGDRIDIADALRERATTLEAE
jgi:hypothetical protein